MVSSRPTLIITTSFKYNDWSLLDDPAILQLCSSSTVFDKAGRDELHDPKASSKIVVGDSTSICYRQRSSVSSSITLDSIAARSHNLHTTLKLTEDDLARHSAALRHAQEQVDFLHSENAARFDQTQELAAQVHELERVRGWGKKKLKREIRMLTGDLYEQDARLTMQVHRLRELEASLWEWKEYALRLEKELA